MTSNEVTLIYILSLPNSKTKVAARFSKLSNMTLLVMFSIGSD